MHLEIPNYPEQSLSCRSKDRISSAGYHQTSVSLALCSGCHTDAIASTAENCLVQPKACPGDSVSDPELGA